MKSISTSEITEMPEVVEIPEWQKMKLEERMEAYNTSPDEGSTWKEVKKRLRLK